MLKFFNTLGGEKQTFKPLEDNLVKVYTCGPTLYNYVHVGNLSAYISADILKRYLHYSGYEVLDVMNLTDVDDKTIRDARQAGKGLKEFTDFYEQAFWNDLDRLNISRPRIVCRATEHIKEMISMIEILLKKGHAYRSDDGSIYFKIKTFSKYGELAGIKPTDLKEGASGRIKKDEYEKENASDFVLWKAWNEADGDVCWDSPFGSGRPGWHIECSAMSNKYLGKTFDIHTGGADLVFPHHQNEIAQSEASTGEKFVNFWLHRGFLKVEGQKMSKSLGNFYTLSDIKGKVNDILSFRYLVAVNHYRLPLNFTFDSLFAAEASLKKLREFARRLALLDSQEKEGEIEKTKKAVKKAEKEFRESMDDDLSAPPAIATLFELVANINKRIDAGVLGKESGRIVLDHLYTIDQVWGFLFKEEEILDTTEERRLRKLIAERDRARIDKDWENADRIREEIEALGFALEDKDGKTVFKKK